MPIRSLTLKSDLVDPKGLNPWTSNPRTSNSILIVIESNFLGQIADLKKLFVLADPHWRPLDLGVQKLIKMFTIILCSLSYFYTEILFSKYSPMSKWLQFRGMSKHAGLSRLSKDDLCDKDRLIFSRLSENIFFPMFFLDFFQSTKSISHFMIRMMSWKRPPDYKKNALKD